jgi:hypothetical protein
MQQISPMKPTTSTIESHSLSSTVVVNPRVFNLQTIVPKPTTHIQLGNTKIILVSPSTTSVRCHQTSLNNGNPIKLVKLTPSTLTLPRNVQIVLPSRTSMESSMNIYRTLDSIPAATQEVTIATSNAIHKPRRRSSTSTPIDKPVGKILRPIAKVLPVYSSNAGRPIFVEGNVFF